NGSSSVTPPVPGAPVGAAYCRRARGPWRPRWPCPHCPPPVRMPPSSTAAEADAHNASFGSADWNQMWGFDPAHLIPPSALSPFRWTQPGWLPVVGASAAAAEPEARGASTGHSVCVRRARQCRPLPPCLRPVVPVLAALPIPCARVAAAHCRRAQVP
ncbi:hypothetical protein EVAR_70852_1, partial [Eumeta japonica]